MEIKVLGPIQEPENPSNYGKGSLTDFLANQCGIKKIQDFIVCGNPGGGIPSSRILVGLTLPAAEMTSRSCIIT